MAKRKKDDVPDRAESIRKQRRMLATALDYAQAFHAYQGGECSDLMLAQAESRLEVCAEEYTDARRADVAALRRAMKAKGLTP